MIQTNKSEFKNRGGIKHLIDAFGYSCSGLKAAWIHESSFRLLVLLALISISFALFMSLSATSKAILVTVSFLPIFIELFNSAIEAAVDYISLERHPLAKRAKDMGSAAQLIGLINLAAVWIIILLEHYGLLA